MNQLHLLRSSLAYRAMQSRKIPTQYRNAPSVDFICVRITGGIGDLLLGLGVAESLAERCGKTVIYSKWPAIAAIFTALPCKPEIDLATDERITSDVIINISPLAVFQFSQSFEGFRNPELEKIFIENKRFMTTDSWEAIAQSHPYMDHLLGIEGRRLGVSREEISYKSLGLGFKPFLRTPVLRPTPIAGRYITVHNGFDTNHSFVGRSTKNWGASNWREFVLGFKRNYPMIKVVQLGAINSGPIPGIDISRVGNASFEDTLSIMSSSLCHVDGDSGLVHAARIIGVRSIVLFGPTPADFFGYLENINLTPRNLCPGDCWWLDPYWVQRCPVGFASCEAIDSISPQRVLVSIGRILSEKEERSSYEATVSATRVSVGPNRNSDHE